MDAYKIYIGGEFCETSSVLDVIEPFTGKPFAYTFSASNEQLEDAINKAQAVQKEMKHMPSHKKQSILLDIAAKMQKSEKHLATILAREAGKPIKYAVSEIKRAVQVLKVAAEECKRLPKEYFSVDWTPAGENKEGFVKHFPIGTVAGISPFNFPMNLAVHKIAPAIAAGCPIVLKPASSTPLSTLELARIIDQTALPKGALSILPMNRSVGNAIVEDNRFNLLTFTGSPEVGWNMKEKAGKKRVVLELGGNAACVITDSANLNAAVKKSIVGAFAYSGQVCIHAQRFFAHSEIYTDFLQQMIDATTKLKIGNPLNIDTDVSVMIDETNAKRVESWINEAIEQGATLVCGGERKGLLIEPTILTNTKADMKINSQEVFGPVITIEPYENFDEAIEKVNDTVFGLQAGVFTDKVSEMNTAFNEIEAGGVIINDVPTFRVDHMPYGGIKDSGFDREGVKYAIQHMMEPKLMIKNY